MFFLKLPSVDVLKPVCNGEFPLCLQSGKKDMFVDSLQIAESCKVKIWEFSALETFFLRDVYDMKILWAFLVFIFNFKSHLKLSCLATLKWPSALTCSATPTWICTPKRLRIFMFKLNEVIAKCINKFTFSVMLLSYRIWHWDKMHLLGSVNFIWNACW